MALSADLKEFVQGQRITKVLLNRVWDNVRGAWVYDPSIHLANGVVIHFGVQETEIGEYGVQPVINTLNLKIGK